MTAIADIAALEQSLQTTWDEALLAVYADALQAAGDPRGELIAIDLHIAAHGRTREIEARRRDRLYAWLGGKRLVGPGCDAEWLTRWFRYGLLDDFEAWARGRDAEYHAALLASPVGGYLRGASLNLPPAAVDRVAARFAARLHPWLRKLRIGATYGEAVVASATAEALVAATPQLHTLALATQTFEALPFHHPTVVRLELVGVAVRVRRRVIDPDISELALVHMNYESTELAQLLGAFPALRRLELDPRDPYDRLWQPPLHELPDCVETLCLPPSRDPAGCELFVELVEQRPHLRLEVRGGYAESSHAVEPFRHPRIVEHPLRPWPRYPRLASLRVAGERIPLATLVAAMETQYDRFDQDERDAWRVVWDGIENAPSTIESATLVQALAALDEDLQLPNGAMPWTIAKALESRSTVSLHVA